MRQFAYVESDGRTVTWSPSLLELLSGDYHTHEGRDVPLGDAAWRLLHVSGQWSLAVIDPETARNLYVIPLRAGDLHELQPDGFRIARRAVERGPDGFVPMKEVTETTAQPVPA